MDKYKPLRKCISSNEEELIIWGADNFSQFPRKDISISSKCDRTIAVACRGDLVVLRGKLDIAYYNWSHSGSPYKAIGVNKISNLYQLFSHTQNPVSVKSRCYREQKFTPTVL